MRKKVKNTIAEIALGAVLGAVGMGWILWVGLDMHFPERPAVVEAATSERDYPELMMVDPAEMADLRAGAGSCEGEISDDEVIAETVVEQPEYNQSDLDLLAAIIYAEAGDQVIYGTDALRYVGDVIMNRVHSPAWPDTVSSVVYQSGQFSPVTDGGLDRAWGRVTPECYEAARLALSGDQLNTQIIYFSMGYCANGTFAFQYGDHYFGY